MNKKLRRNLLQIIIAGILFAGSWFPVPEAAQLTMLAAAYLIVGGEIIMKALRNIRRGQVFDENFLMALATFGACFLGEYSEAVAVMLFFQIGEFFQKYAVGQSRRSIAALMDIRPDYARVCRGKKFEIVSPEQVSVGEIIEVRPGERIPLDGVIVRGKSTLDTSALTGESVPGDVVEGDDVISGCINLNGVIGIKVTKKFTDSTVARILDLVENAGSQKARIENFITRFARWYTPTVVIIAVLLAVVPPILVEDAAFRDWGYRAITFLVISCPCALVISIPLSFFGGIGAASKCGILIKGSNYLEALSHAETVVFDKTGTLTKGEFVVSEICPAGVSKKRLLEVAAHIEAYSHHPIAESIKKAYGRHIDLQKVSNVKEIFGTGIVVRFDGCEAAAGNAKMLRLYGISLPEEPQGGTAVYVVINKKYAGFILVEDEVKPDAAEAIVLLRKLGVHRTVMLTGDREHIGRAVAEKTGLDDVYAELLPEDKVAKMETLLHGKSCSGKVLFVGDGINDAPVLARSDVGIAMGGIGSDAAIEAADIVIMTDEPSKIASAVRISQRTLMIAKENIVFAIGIKLLVLGLGAAGFASIWAAVFADVGVSVIAILNAVRVLGFYKSCR